MNVSGKKYKYGVASICLAVFSLILLTFLDIVSLLNNSKASIDTVNPVGLPLILLGLLLGVVGVFKSNSAKAVSFIGIVLSLFTLFLFYPQIILLGDKIPTKAPAPITKQEGRLLNKLKYDSSVFSLVKELGKSNIVPLKNENNNVVGIKTVCVHNNSYHLCSILNHNFNINGLDYYAFTCEIGYDSKSDQIGIIKTEDPNYILKAMLTNGINYDVSNQDVINKLKEWDKRYPFNIVGANRDWVEIEFKSTPEPLEPFCRQVYQFCPDTVDQGVGSIENLENEIRKTHRLFLWWD